MGKTQEDLNNLILQEIQKISNVNIDTINNLEKDDDYYYMLYNLENVNKNYSKIFYTNPYYDKNDMASLRGGGRITFVGFMILIGFSFFIGIMVGIMNYIEEDNIFNEDFIAMILCVYIPILLIWFLLFVVGMSIMGWYRNHRKNGGTGDIGFAKDNDDNIVLDPTNKDEKLYKDTDFINCYLNPNGDECKKDKDNKKDTDNLSDFNDNKESFIKKINKTYNLENL